MKKLTIEIVTIILVAVTAAFFFNLISGNNINIFRPYKSDLPEGDRYEPEVIDIEIFKFYLGKKGTIVLDARTEDDFRAGHIPGAAGFNTRDFERIFRERGELLKLGKTILIYCSGPGCTDSSDLAIKLHGKGIKEIFVFKGGIEEWISAGDELEYEEAD